ncbi:MULTISPECIES: DUF192 domain-containing protein [Salinicola]|uniref:DUF192 domain-containing protein n=1 Tax=Salinicola TaxID=404432 RepID=UPI000B4046B2|nr:DUF192 domain-containing protein [Salinicola salarius]
MLARVRACGVWVLCALFAVPAWAETLPRQTVILDDGRHEHTLHVEVARTASERARGLMERESLAENAGMLFLYDREQPGSNAYWMYKTRIPLDIAFIGGDGVIRSLRTMPPCHATSSRDCPVYPAGAPFWAALEANAGYFDAHDLAVGDRVDLSSWLAP